MSKEIVRRKTQRNIDAGAKVETPMANVQIYAQLTLEEKIELQRLENEGKRDEMSFLLDVAKELKEQGFIAQTPSGYFLQTSKQTYPPPSEFSYEIEASTRPED